VEVGILIPVIVVMLVLLFAGTPVPISMALAGTLGLGLLHGGSGLLVSVQTMFNGLNDFIILAVPMFILMGVILSKGKIGERLYSVFDVFLRHIPGGVGVATIITCMFLAAMVGTSVAVAAMVGSFALREMHRLGYPLHLSMGAVIAGGALGMLIPPSLPMILFGVITLESIGQLFMAGMFPGILAGVLFCAWMVFAFRREEKGKVAPPASKEEKLKALKEGYWGILIPVIIIVMLYTGIATPTEIAAIGCALSFIVAVFIYRTISLKELFPVIKEGLTAAVMVLFIIAGALVLASFVTQAGVSQAVADLFVGGGIPLWGFLAITMLILLGMGCLMEGAGLMLLMLPILHPTIEAYGFSLLVYAVIMVINIECAMLTPPVGLNLYAVDGIAKMQGLPSNMGIAVKGSLPFFFLYIVTMILVIVFPALVTWLPAHTM